MQARPGAKTSRRSIRNSALPRSSSRASLIYPRAPARLRTVSPEDEKQAREGLDSIANEGKLGAVLLQFPVSFKNEDDRRDYLFALIRRFNQYPLVLEIRHESWNDPEILARLAEQGVGFCNIDQPRLGKSLSGTQHVTSPVGYVRLHGRNFKEWFESESRNARYNYLYSQKELSGWVAKIKSVDQNSQKTYAITNNHPDGKAAVNALELKNMLTGRKVKAPDVLVKRYPKELSEIVDAESGSLYK